MKFSLFKNDKSTLKDEVILSIITLVSLTIGVLLVVFKPSFWLITESHSVVFGVLMVLLAVMYTPCVVYRFLTNEITNKE